MTDTQIFDTGDVTLQSGQTLHGAVIAYATLGTLNADKSHVVRGITPLRARHGGCEHFISAGKAIDPGKHCGGVFDTTGNGLSLPPSNAPLPSDVARFPSVSVYANVLLQFGALTEVLAIERIALAFGRRCGKPSLEVESVATRPGTGRYRFRSLQGIATPSTI